MYKYNVEIKLRMSFSSYFPASKNFETPDQGNRMMKHLRLLTGETKARYFKTKMTYQMKNTITPIRVVVQIR